MDVQLTKKNRPGPQMWNRTLPGANGMFQSQVISFISDLTWNYSNIINVKGKQNQKKHFKKRHKYFIVIYLLKEDFIKYRFLGVILLGALFAAYFNSPLYALMIDP